MLGDNKLKGLIAVLKLSRFEVFVQLDHVADLAFFTQMLSVAYLLRKLGQTLNF